MMLIFIMDIASITGIFQLGKTDQEGDISIPAGEAETWEKIYYRKIKDDELMVGRLGVAPEALQ